MLQDEVPSRPRRSSSVATDATTSGLAYSPANPSRDDGFRPLTSTSTTTSTSPQLRTRQGRQGLAREEDVWSHDAETAIFSIYSMYGVSVRDSVVPPSARQSQTIDNPPSTSAAVPQPLRASQIGPKDIVGGTFSASSAAAMNGKHQHQYHDRRPTKEQFEAFSFGTKPAAAPRNVSRFSEDTTASSAARSESLYSSSSRGQSGSEEGTIEAAMVQKVGGAKAPPSAFHMDGEDWVVANPRLSFQLGTVLTTPAAEETEDPMGQMRGIARPESRLTLDLDPVVPQDSNTSAKGSYTRHRLLSAASGTNLPNTALATPTTADSVYGTPLTSVPADTPFFSLHNPQSPPLTPASRRDISHQEGYDHSRQGLGAKPLSGVGLAISQPPDLSARPEPRHGQTAPEHNGYTANGATDYPSRNQHSGENQQEGPEMYVQRRQPFSSSSRASSQYQLNQSLVNGHVSSPTSSTVRPSTPNRSSRPPSPNSAHADQHQYQNATDSSSPRRSGPAPSPMVLTSPSPIYPPSSYNPSHSPSRPPSRNRTPQSHSPGPSRNGTPVDASGQTLGPPVNGSTPLLPKTPSRSQLRQVHTASTTSQNPPPSRISHSAQSSASTNHRNPSPSYNTPHISYSPPSKSDPSSLQSYPPISVSRIHSRQESTSTTSHAPSQLSQTPSTQYAPSTQSHQYSQHSSTSTGASQSQYQPSMSNGYYQSQMQYEDRNHSFESKECPQPPLPSSGGSNRALQLHLAVHNSPSRSSLSKNGQPPQAPTLRAKRSAASLAPSLVPSIGEEPDAFHVRNTYAQLEMFGVKGDGYEEGVERTRAARGRIDSSLPKSPEAPRETFQRTRSQVLADDAIADDNEKKRELKPEEVKLLSSVDRYGFFTVPTHERYVVMPAQPLQRPLTASSPQSPQASGNGPPPPRSLDRLPPASVNPKETARIAKWNRMLVPHARDEGGNVQAWRIRPSKVNKVRGRVYKGVPDRWRAAVWEVLMSAYVIGHEGHSGKAVDVPRLTSSSEAATRNVKDTERSAGEYREGIEKPSTYDVQIDLDVPRTISGHIMFRTRYGAGQRSLFHVLHAFSLVCAQCGYVQGMGPIAATLLSYLPPSLSYTALVRLHTSYNMHTIFSPGFPGLLEAIYVQEQITKMYMPNVYEAFKNHMISSTSYATKWYITLFAGVVPWQVMLRLWDVFWLEGSDVFIGLAVGVLWAYRDQITSPQANFETVLSLLSSFFVPEDEDLLLSWLEKMLGDAKLRNSMKTWRAQWQELVRTGKEGDALL